MGVGYMVEEALLLSQQGSDLIHTKGCVFSVLIFDIFQFLLLGFVPNFCWNISFELIKSVNVCVILRTVRVQRKHSIEAIVIFVTV